VPVENASGVRITYSSLRQAQSLIDEIKKTGGRRYYSFAQRLDPCLGIFGKIMSFFLPPNPTRNVCVTVQTNVPGFDLGSEGSKEADDGEKPSKIKNVWLTTDTVTMQEVDPATLEPVGLAKQEKLHPLLKGPGSCAHAQRDPVTGDMFNYNIEYGKCPTYRVFKVSAETGKTEILATIQDMSVRAAYMHSFFLTTNHVILCVPVSHYGLNGLKIVWEKNLLDAIEPFDQSKFCKWIIVDRKHGRGVVAVFESPASFFFHSVNSYEETIEGEDAINIFCEFIRYPNHDVMYTFLYDVVTDRDDGFSKFWREGERAQNFKAALVRYKFKIPTPTLPSEKLNYITDAPEEMVSIPAPHVGELPTINPEFNCRRHRYVYTILNRGLSTLVDGIGKTDTDTRSILIWNCPVGHTPGEAIFIPRPTVDGQINEEDDGVLLSVVLDGTNEKSYLVCLDAKTMKETGRAECDFAIGLGFHGLHTPLA
jgi:torulene dioxygenase